MSHSTDRSAKSASAPHSPVENNLFSPREGETSVKDTFLHPPDFIPSCSVTEPHMASTRSESSSSAFSSNMDERVREEGLHGHRLHGEAPMKDASDEVPSHSSFERKSTSLKNGSLSLSSPDAFREVDNAHPLPSEGEAENNPIFIASELPLPTASAKPPPDDPPFPLLVPQPHASISPSNNSLLPPNDDGKEEMGKPSHVATLTHPEERRIGEVERRDLRAEDKHKGRQSLRITVPVSHSSVLNSSKDLALSASLKKPKPSCTPLSTTRTTAWCRSRSPDVQKKEEKSPVIVREGSAKIATLLVDADYFCSEKIFSATETNDEEEVAEGHDVRMGERLTSGRQRLNSIPGSLCSNDSSIVEEQVEDAIGTPTAPGSRGSSHSNKTIPSRRSSDNEKTRKNSEHFSAIDLVKFPTISVPRAAVKAEHNPLSNESEYFCGASESGGEEPKAGKEEERAGEHVPGAEWNADGVVPLSSTEGEESNAHATASQRLDEVLRNSALFKGIHLRYLLLFLICIVCAFVIIFLFQFFHFTNKNSLFNGRNSVFEKSGNVLGSTELLIIDTMNFLITDGQFNSTPPDLIQLCSRVSNAPMGFATYNLTTFELIKSWDCPNSENETFHDWVPVLETASDAVQFVDHSANSVLAFIAPYRGKSKTPWSLMDPRASSSGMNIPSSAPTTTSSCVDGQTLLSPVDTVEGVEETYDGGALPSCENHSILEVTPEGKAAPTDRIYTVLLSKEQFGRIVLSTFDYKYSTATLQKTIEAFLARSWNSSEINVFLHSLTPQYQTYASQTDSDVSISMKEVYDQDCQDLSEVWHTVLHVARNLSLYNTRHPIVNPQLEYSSVFRLLSSVTLCSVVCTKNDMSEENFTENIENLYCEKDNPTNLWFIIRVEDFGQRLGVLMTVIIGSISVAVFCVLILIIYISVAVPVGFIRQQLFRIVGVHQNIPPWKKSFYQCSYPLWIGDISSLTSSLHVLGISFNMNKKYVPNHILRKHAREMEAMCQKFRTGDLFDILSDSHDVQAEEVEQLEDLSEFVHLNADPGRGGRREGGSRLRGGSSGDNFAGSSGGLHHRGNRGSGKGMPFPSARYLFSGAGSMLDTSADRWALDGEQESGSKPLMLAKESDRVRLRESNSGPLDISKHFHTPPRRGSKDALVDVNSYRARDEWDLKTSQPRRSSTSWFSGGNGAAAVTEDGNMDVKMLPVPLHSHQDSATGTQSVLETSKKKVVSGALDSFFKESHPLTFWRRWSNTILKPGGGSEDSRCSPPPLLGGGGVGGGPSPELRPHSTAESRSSSRLTGMEHSAERQEILPSLSSSAAPSKENTTFSSSSTMVIKQAADATILVVKLDCIDNVYLINFEVALRQHRRIMRYLLARIRHWGGAVFHRSGDCLAAAWNAFDTCPNHASRATACGMEIVGAFAVYRSLGLLVGVVVHAGMFICGIFEDAKEAFSTAFGAAAREAMLISDLVATQNGFGLIVSEPVKQATAGLYDSIIVDVIKHPDDVHPIVLFELRYRPLPLPDDAVSSVAVKNRQQFSIQYAKAFAHFLQHEYANCIKLLLVIRDIAPEETQPQLARMELLSYYFDSHPDEMPPFPYFRPVPAWANFEKKAWREWQAGRSEKTITVDPLPPQEAASPNTSRPSVSWLAKNAQSSSGFGSSFLHLGGRRRSSSVESSERNGSATTASVSLIDHLRNSFTQDGTSQQPRTPKNISALTPVPSRKDSGGGDGIFYSAPEAKTDPLSSSLPVHRATAVRPRSRSRDVRVSTPEGDSVPSALPSSPSVFTALRGSFSHFLSKKDKKRKRSKKTSADEPTDPQARATEMEETMMPAVSPMIPPLASPPSSILTSAREGKRKKASGMDMRHSNTPTFPHPMGSPENKPSAFSAHTGSSTSRTGEEGPRGWEKEEKRYKSSSSFLGGVAVPILSSEEKRLVESKVSVSDLSAHDGDTPQSSSARRSMVSKLHSTHATPTTIKVPRSQFMRWSRRSSKKPESSLPSVDAVLSTPSGEPLRSTSFSFPARSPVELHLPQGKRKLTRKGRMPSALSFLSIQPNSSTPLSASLPPSRPFADPQTNYAMFAVFPPSPSSPAAGNVFSPSLEDSVGSDGGGFSSLLGGLQARRQSFPLGEVEMDRDIQGFKKDLQDNIRRHQSSSERLTVSSLGPEGMPRDGGESRVEKDECLATPMIPPPLRLPPGPAFPLPDGRTITSSYRPPPIRTTSPPAGSVGSSPHQNVPFVSTPSTGSQSSEGTGVHSAGIGYPEDAKKNGAGAAWKGEGETSVLRSQHPSQDFFSAGTSFVGSHHASTVAKEDSKHLDPIPVPPMASSSGGSGGAGGGGGGILMTPSDSKSSQCVAFVSPSGKPLKPPSQRYANRSSPSISPLSAHWNTSHPATPATPAASLFSNQQPSFGHSLHRDPSARGLGGGEGVKSSVFPSAGSFSTNGGDMEEESGGPKMPRIPSGAHPHSSRPVSSTERRGTVPSSSSSSFSAAAVLHGSPTYRRLPHFSFSTPHQMGSGRSIGNSAGTHSGSGGGSGSVSCHSVALVPAKRIARGEGRQEETPKGTPVSTTSPIASHRSMRHSSHFPPSSSDATQSSVEGKPLKSNDAKGNGKGGEKGRAEVHPPLSPLPLRPSASHASLLPQGSPPSSQWAPPPHPPPLPHSHSSVSRPPVPNDREGSHSFSYHDVSPLALYTPTGLHAEEHRNTRVAGRSSSSVGSLQGGEERARLQTRSHGVHGSSARGGEMKTLSPHSPAWQGHGNANFLSVANASPTRRRTSVEGGGEEWHHHTPMSIHTNSKGSSTKGSSLQDGNDGSSSSPKSSTVDVEGKAEGSGDRVGQFLVPPVRILHASAERREDAEEKEGESAAQEERIEDTPLSWGASDVGGGEEEPDEPLPYAAAITGSIIESIGLTLPTVHLPYIPAERTDDAQQGRRSPSVMDGKSLPLSTSHPHAGVDGAGGLPPSFSISSAAQSRRSQRSSSVPPQAFSVPTTIMAKNGILYQRSERVLGSGSFGSVYLGMDVRSGKLVAIKVLRLPTAETEGKNVEAEALIMRVKDPHVVEFISYAFQDHSIIIIMECMLAGSLHNMLTSFRVLPSSTARVFIRDVLRGLNKLHSMGVIHRDVKPQNVLLTPGGNCKITDFGASAELAQLAHGNTVHGTPVYLAPEAARGNPAAVSDIWSCGIMFIQLLTGTLPYPLEKLQLPAEILVFQIGAGICTPTIPEDSLDELELDFVVSCLVTDQEKRPSASRLLQSPLFVV